MRFLLAANFLVLVGLCLKANGKFKKTGVINTIIPGSGLLEPPPEDLYDEASENYFEALRQKRTAVPDSYSSRSYGLVTPVRDQLGCGSCTAFATMALIETCFKKITNVDGDYSEQQLIDCGYEQQGASACDGAPPSSYAQWAAETDLELAHESQYPYLNKEPNYYCPPDLPVHNQGAHISGYFSTPLGDEEMMKQLVFEHGAVLTGVKSNGTITRYQAGDGIYDKCPVGDLGIDHAVAVVGYGTENGVDYWEVKNSWGEDWGDQGYFRIKRGVNMCGIGKSITIIECDSTPGPTDPPLTTKKPCFDKYSDCEALAETSCFRSHISENCPIACGLCEGMTPVPSNTCYNAWSNCDYHAETSCFAPKIADNCPKACGLCEGMTPVPSNTCYNVWSNCDYHAETSCFESYIAENCPKACGLCEGMTPVPSITCYNEYFNCNSMTPYCDQEHIAEGCKKACNLC